MAISISWDRSAISRYLSGKDCRGKVLCPVKLQKAYTSLMEDLRRNNLPCAVPHAPTTSSRDDSNPAASSSPSQTSPLDVATTTADTTTHITAHPSSSSSRPDGRTTFILTVDLKEIKGCKDGGHAVIMGLGMPPADPTDLRWQLDFKSIGTHALLIREGMCGRRTFKRGKMEGRTFEWIVSTLEDQNEIQHAGGPLWLAREITAASWAIADVSGFNIVGRRLPPSSGMHTGPSSPALLWRAIEAIHGAPKQNALACCGLTHPHVQELIGYANAPTVVALPPLLLR